MRLAKEKNYYANINKKWKIQTPILHIQEKNMKKIINKKNTPILHLQEKEWEKNQVKNYYSTCTRKKTRKKNKILNPIKKTTINYKEKKLQKEK